MSTSNESEFNKPQFNMLNVIDKKRVLDTYKIVLCLREPLIKVNPFYSLIIFRLRFGFYYLGL